MQNFNKFIMETETEPIRRRIWNGSLPAKFYSASHPDICCFLMLKRCSYLPLVTPTVRCHLLGSAASIPSQLQQQQHSHDSKAHKLFTGTDMDIWYSFNGRPLKWNYPIGLLFDLLTRDSQDNNNSPLPWRIAVHFYDPYPVDRIIPMLNYDYPKEMFMGLVKQADYIRSGGSTRSLLAMLSKTDQTKLWDGLWSDNFDRFWQSNGKLVAGLSSQQHIPIRVYLPPKPTADDWPPPVQDLINVITRSTNDASVLPTTVQDLQRLLLDRYPQLADGFGSPRSDAVAAAKMIIHGIEVPQETPLGWLADKFVYPDGFLHFVLVYHHEW